VSDNVQSGMTLVEVLVAMALAGIIAAAAYAILQVHQRMALRVEEDTLMQQELLTATTQITEELRMCGYSPTGAPAFGFRHRPGIGAPDYGREVSARGVYCTLDRTGDGAVNEDGSSGDHIGFRLNIRDDGSPRVPPDNVLRKYDTGAVKWQPLCTNIGELRFIFRGPSGQVIDDPGNSAGSIRMVEVHVTAVPSAGRTHLGISNRTMITAAACRNLPHGSHNP